MQYLDDGKMEKAVPASELRLTSELNMEGPRVAPPKPLPLPLEGILHEGSGPTCEAIAMTPRATVHCPRDAPSGGGGGGGGGGRGARDEAKQSESKGGEREDKDGGTESTVFVLEGQQESLATGGGVRGIRFLRNSARA